MRRQPLHAPLPSIISRRTVSRGTFFHMTEESAAQFRAILVDMLDAGLAAPWFLGAVRASNRLFDGIVRAGKEWPDLKQVCQNMLLFLCSLVLDHSSCMLCMCSFKKGHDMSRSPHHSISRVICNILCLKRIITGLTVLVILHRCPGFVPVY